MANKNPANAGFFFIYHPRSNGLITPSPPRFITCRYRSVVDTLHCADVIAFFQQVSCKGMEEGVRPTQFGYPGFCRSLLNMLANIVLMIMMAAYDTGLRISGRLFGRKDKLPDFL